MRTRVLGIGLAATLLGPPAFAQVTAEQLATVEIRTEKVGDKICTCCSGPAATSPCRSAHKAC